MNRHERRKQERLGATDIRHNSRTVEIRVYVNTDEDEHAVAERVNRAARGPKLHMAVTTAGVLDPEQARGFWEAVVKHAEEAVENES